MKKYKSLRKHHRIKRKKSIFQNRFSWLILLILIISGIIFYFTILGSIFQIKEIKISGNQKIFIKDLQDLVEKKVEQKILFFNSKSIFLINLDEIENEILEKFPQITEIKSERKFPDKLSFIIEERKPVAIFCFEENYFFIDKEGIIFEEIAEAQSLQFNQEGELEIKKLILDKTPDLGEKVVDPKKISQILEIESKLKNLKILIKEVSIISNQRLNVKTLEGWEIYFNPKGDLNWQITELGIILERHIPLERRGELQYIDLRFSKIFIYPEFK